MRALAALTIAGFIDFARGRVFATVFAAGVALVIAALIFQELSASAGQRVLGDIGLAFISMVVAMLAAIVPLSTVAKEIDSRQVHQLLARPISRATYVLARFLAAAGLVLASNVALGGLLCGLLLLTGGGSMGPLAWFAAVFASLEGLIMVSLAILFGVNSSVPMSAVFLTLVFVVGRLSYAVDAAIIAKLDGNAEQLVLAAARLLPAFGRFDLTAALHGVPLDAGELARTAVYGIVYAAGILLLGTWRLHRRDLI